MLAAFYHWGFCFVFRPFSEANYFQEISSEVEIKKTAFNVIIHGIVSYSFPKYTENNMKGEMLLLAIIILSSCCLKIKRIRMVSFSTISVPHFITLKVMVVKMYMLLWFYWSVLYFLLIIEYILIIAYLTTYMGK